MRTATATGPGGTPVDATAPSRSTRRESLLDVAAEMVAAGDVERVSMESVAVGAGVSRSLVYKHFANRHELLGALYERESSHLHDELSAAVQAEAQLAAMLRALVRGALAAQATRGATLAALSAGGGRGSTQRDVQRRRDRATLRHFTRCAAAQFDLDEADVRPLVGLALGTIPTVLAQWRRRPTPERATQLEEAYVRMVVGGLRELARDVAER